MSRPIVLCALVGAVSLSGALEQQSPATLTKMDRQRGLAMLRQFRDDIHKHYYDPSFRGTDIAGKFAAAEQMIQNATSLSEVYALITDTAMALDDSHTFFIPPDRNAAVDYGWRMAAVGNDVFVVDVTRGSDADAKGLAPGDRVIALNRFEPNRQNLWYIAYLYGVVRPQQMQRLIVRKTGGDQRVLDIASKITPRRFVGFVDFLNESLRRTRAHRHELVLLDSDILVWRMPDFEDLDQMQDAIRRARRASVVVLDLRGNGGGLLETLLQMTGWFFDRAIRVATLKERNKEETLTTKRRNDPVRARLVVLVDSESGSAAEMFARIVQIEKRGVVLGDRTAGAVMTARVEPHSLGVDTMTFYGTSVTVADVRMSDGLTLEKIGVTPDEIVLPSAADLAANRDPVLARAVSIAGGTLTPEAAGRIYAERTR